MGINYGSLQSTFYRDFERHKELEPSSGAIGGPITYSRNSTATYIGSNGYLQTASVNEPRFGYEYDSNGTLQYRGLLIEPAAGNNYLLYSEDFSQANWTKTSCSVNSVSITNPDGSTTGQKIAKSSNGGSISQSYTTNYINANTSYARAFHFSVIAKASECGYLLMIISNGTENIYCYYDLNNGIVGTNGGGANNLIFIYKHIMNMGNGWYRCFFCVRDDNQTNKTYTFSYVPTTTSTGQTINNSGDGAYLWGAMVFYQPHYALGYQQTAKSYIKTTSTISINQSDVCYVGYYTDNRNISRLFGSHDNTQISLFGQFSTPQNNFKIGITQNYMGIGIPPTSFYYRQTNSSCNVLLRRSGIPVAMDYGSFPILDNNNKAILTYGIGKGSKACMNNGIIYNANAYSLDILDPIFSIGFGGDAYYKKIFCVPTILSDRHMKALTIL